MPGKIPFYKKEPLKDRTPFALYDLSIEDVKERAEKRLIFNSGREAASYLGCRGYQTLLYYSNNEAVRKGKKYFSEKLNKHFAIRRLNQQKTK